MRVMMDFGITSRDRTSAQTNHDDREMKVVANHRRQAACIVVGRRHKHLKNVTRVMRYENILTSTRYTSLTLSTHAERAFKQ